MAKVETADRSWLMVIDHQPAFSHPDSPWYAADMARTVVNVATLVPLYGERVLFTRFVPPAKPHGSWQAYYEKWPFAVQADADWLWAVDAPWQNHRSVSSHTFSKWTPQTRDIMVGAEEVVMCGVSTDCCVLATAFAAVDDGMQVRLVEDACVAKTPAIHGAALELLSRRAPQLSISTTQAEVERLLLAP